MNARQIAFTALSLALAGCAANRVDAPAKEGELASFVREEAKRAGVPEDLALAIGVVEEGIRLPKFRVVDPHDDVPVAGIFELRHGAFDSLRRGAEITSSNEDDLRADTDRATIAGLAVLRELAESAPSGDLLAWRDAVGTLSGFRERARRDEYVARVYRVLRAGGTFRARGGEDVVVRAHPEIPVAWTFVAPDLLPQGTPDSSLVTQWVDTPDTGPAPAGSTCTAKWDTSHSEKDFIAIHDTEGSWDASLATLQNDGCKSVQYMIDADGSRVAQFVPETTVAYHVGNYFYNQRAIGIEHVGTASNPAGYSDAMYAKSVALVLDIAQRHAIPIDRAHIFGHYQVPNGNLIPESDPPCSLGLDACEKSPNYGGANNHRDPGYYWQWCQYFEKLGGTCACNDAWPLWNCTSDGQEVWRCDNGNLEKMDCPGGCNVMPVGTPDECLGASGSGGSGGSGGAGGAGGSSAGGQTNGGAGGTGAGGTGNAGAANGGAANAGTSSAGTASSAGGTSSNGGKATNAGGTANASAGTSPHGGASGGPADAGSGGGKTVTIVPDAGADGGCSASVESHFSLRSSMSGGVLAILVAALRRGGARRRLRLRFVTMNKTPETSEHIAHLRGVLEAYMAKKGLRSTEQRRLIVETFFQSAAHLTIEDLLAQVRANDPRVGYATVYRTLKLLAECGVAHERRFGDGVTRYEVANDDHHHDHLICIECGSIEEFEEPKIETLQDEVARRYGFEVRSHKHELYGVCASCRAKSLAAQKRKN